MTGSGNGMVTFNKTCIGYNHIMANTICQDNSISYQDNNKCFIATCDGHGGSIYIRSNIGSKLACKASFNILSKLSYADKSSQTFADVLEKVKLEILCEWNHLVEDDFIHRPFIESEFEELDDKQIARLKENYVTAYGTTMHAVMAFEGVLTCVSIGDGGLFLIKDDQIYDAFPEAEDENVANITCSLCSDNAYDYIHAKAFIQNEVDGVICLTDGVLNPYQNYENFRNSFVLPVVKEVKDNGLAGGENVKKFICELGMSKGIGDDVSFAMIYGGEQIDA